MTTIFTNSSVGFNASSLMQLNTLLAKKFDRKVSTESCNSSSTTDSNQNQKIFSSGSDSPAEAWDDSQEDSFQVLNAAMKPKKKSSVDETKYKTEICKKWAETGHCPYGRKCKFAHGKHELNEKLLSNKRRYKSKKCNSFHSNMNCPYGSRCLFAHEQRTLEELQCNLYEQCLAFPELLISNSVRKARLPVFISAVNDTENTMLTPPGMLVENEFEDEFEEILKMTCQ